MVDLAAGIADAPTEFWGLLLHPKFFVKKQPFLSINLFVCNLRYPSTYSENTVGRTDPRLNFFQKQNHKR